MRLYVRPGSMLRTSILPKLVFACVLCLAQGANAQESSLIESGRTPPADAPAKKTHAGLSLQSPGRFVVTPDGEGNLAFDARLAAQFQHALDSVRIAQKVPGASAAVLIPGQGMWLGVSGVSSVSPAANITPDMAFGIGSNTKAFVSTTVLKLAEAGLLSLDDSLGHWLPAYPNISGAVTIRQLLNMTSGLFDYLNDPSAEGDSVAANPARVWTPEEILTKFVGPPHSPPGGAYRYCNTDYILLGMIIKKAANTSVSSQLRQLLFTPLALDRTYLEVEETHTGPVADPWSQGYDVASMPVTGHFSIYWTAGAIMSTAENMARWSKALYEGALVTPASLSQQQTFIPADGGGTLGFAWTGYGLGVRRGALFGKEVFGHGGQVRGYVSVVAYVPRTKASFVVLLNASEPNELDFLTALLDPYFGTIPAQPARPGIMYALSALSDNAHLYGVDSTTAALNDIGQYLYGEIVSARVHPKTGGLWGISNALGWELVQIDGTTGEAYPRARVVLPPGANSDLKGMDFSPQGTLYVGATDGQVYSIDTATGIGSLVASTKLPISGIALDPVSGKVWASVRANATLRDRLYTISLLTGDTLGIGNTGYSQPLTDIAFDDRGNLFAVVRNGTGVPNNLLARINTSTGRGTTVGSFGRAGIQTIAFSPGVIQSGVDVSQSGNYPAAFHLEQNFPNPFNPSTTIRYSVPDRSYVSLMVYNTLGQRVAVLADQEEEAGYHDVKFDGAGLSSGVYFYRIHVRSLSAAAARDSRRGAEDMVETRRLLLLR